MGPGPAAPRGSFTLSFSWHPHTNITENLPGPGRPAALRCCSRRLTPYQQLKHALIKALSAPPVGTQRGQATPAQPQERRSSHTDAKKKKGALLRRCLRFLHGPLFCSPFPSS